MYQNYERRSTAGPMDWQPLEEGPSRKRPHYDPLTASSSAFISRPSGYQATQPMFPPSASTSTLSQCHTPFLFHTPSSLSPPAPSVSLTSSSFTFDPSAFNPVTAFGVPDVEMDVAGSGGSGGADGGGAGASASNDTNVSASKQKTSVKEDGSQEQPDSAGEEVVVPRKVAGGAVKRELKRREKTSSFRRRHGQSAYISENEDEDNSESDSDTSYNQKNRRRDSKRSSKSSGALLRREATSQRPTDVHYNLHMPGQTVSHGEVPYILLGYLQFFFNLSLVLILLYLAIQFILTVRADINRKVEEVSYEILQEIAGCTSSYLANQCEPERRVPAMHQACTNWEYCMNRDPTVVGRAQVGAETFAGVVNSFVDPISWKTMGFTLVTLSFLTILLNSALSFYRSSHRPSSHSHPSTPPSAGIHHPASYHSVGASSNQWNHSQSQSISQGPGQGQGRYDQWNEGPKLVQ